MTYGFWFYHELRELVGFSELNIQRHAYLKTPSFTCPFKVNISGIRLELFKRNPACVSCDRIGSLWMLQSHKNEPPHLNLYHVGESSEYKRLAKDGLVLMTKDHLIPVSKGGSNTLDNLATMCVICNAKKGNNLPSTKLIKLIKRCQNVSLEANN